MSLALLEFVRNKAISTAGEKGDKNSWQMAGFQGNDTESYFIASLREDSKKKLPVLATVLREHKKIYSLYN